MKTAEIVAGGGQVVACDASERMVELARERLGGHGEVLHLDLKQPLKIFDDVQFDVVISSKTSLNR